MEYKVDDKGLDAAVFLPFVNRVWPGEYDMERTQAALSKTMNITAYDEKTLVGCLRILSDGCYFGTITELLVRPEYQKRGIGSKLLGLAREMPRRCCISARSRGWKNSMRKTGAGGACNPIS